MISKKGQDSAAGAAGLVMFMGFLIIVYMLVIPPADRNELLGINDTEDDANNGNSEGNGQATLLLESPGSLYSAKQKNFEHPLSQVVLSSQSEARVLFEKPSLYLMSSKLDSKTDTIHFSYDSRYEKLGSVLLSFNVEKAYGRLIVELNGEQIFEGSMPRGSQGPIRMPEALIKSNNLLRLSVSSVPWWRFWGRHQYQLNDVKLTGTLSRLDTLEATSIIRLSDQEVNEFQSGFIRFMTECTGGDQGVLKVFINNRLISSSVPSCPGYERIELGPEHLYSGKNEVAFMLSSGAVYISSFVLRVDIKEAKWPIYYFDINSTKWDEIQDENPDIFLELEFIDEGYSKLALFTLNGRKLHMDTKDDTWQKRINGYLRKDSNYIRIEPETDLDVAALRIYHTKQ
jgi:hypothetical protein